MPEYLTIAQYAERRKLDTARVYSAIRLQVIIPNTTHVAGKKLIEWPKYENVIINDKGITQKRKVIFEAKEQLKKEILEELREEFTDTMARAVIDRVKETL